jgi:hypothetical protein
MNQLSVAFLFESGDEFSDDVVSMNIYIGPF